jgi:hypothetical protein
MPLYVQRLSKRFDDWLVAVPYIYSLRAAALSRFALSKEISKVKALCGSNDIYIQRLSKRFDDWLIAAPYIYSRPHCHDLLYRMQSGRLKPRCRSNAIYIVVAVPYQLTSSGRILSRFAVSNEISKQGEDALWIEWHIYIYIYTKIIEAVRQLACSGAVARTKLNTSRYRAKVRGIILTFAVANKLCVHYIRPPRT